MAERHAFVRVSLTTENISLPYQGSHCLITFSTVGSQSSSERVFSAQGRPRYGIGKAACLQLRRLATLAPSISDVPIGNTFILEKLIFMPNIALKHMRMVLIVAIL